jgi:hypothetical protein
MSTTTFAPLTIDDTEALVMAVRREAVGVAVGVTSWTQGAICWRSGGTAGP